MQDAADFSLGENMIEPTLLPNSPPLYAKCLSCPDFVTACRGVDITSLSGAAEKKTIIRQSKKNSVFC